MLTQAQLTTLCDYVKYCRFEAQRKAREAEELSYTAAVNEQRRRERELTRLERAIEAEISGITKGSETGCRKDEGSRQPPATVPRAKRKSSATGKKSKGRAVGITGTSNSAKNANASSGKRGRDRWQETRYQNTRGNYAEEL